jgi:hypothetical protein
VAIGNFAGQVNQGAYSIAIGTAAGYSGQPAKSICLNAEGNNFVPTGTGFFVKPIRGEALGIGVGRLFYNSSNGEITHSTT